MDIGGLKPKRKTKGSESADSDDEVNQKLTLEAKEGAALKPPAKPVLKINRTKKYDHMSGKAWSDDETTILLDFLLDPERVAAVTLDATKFIQQVSRASSLMQY